MSLVTDDFKPSVSTIEEVKKLQDLVRKLELQNLHLRNKQISNRRRSNSPVPEHRPTSNSSRPAKKVSDEKPISDSSMYIENTHYSVRDEYFDDLDIIGVSDIEMSDDESWLYSSPSTLANYKKESPYKWLRKDVDDPENKQLQLAKKALLTKLNELEILSPSTKLNPHHFGSPAVSNVYKSHVYHKTPPTSRFYDPVPIDTRTFTRSKKKQALDFLEKLDLYSNERNLDKIDSVESLNRRGSDMSSDSLSTCHVLEDANDVQEVARMQEESLRMNSPMGTPKRGSLSSTYRKISTSRGSVSDQDVSETSVFSTQSTDDIEQDLFESDSYQMDPLQHSNHSSSSESPYGSNISLHDSGKGTVKLGGYRRSLPNLNRDPTVLRQSRNKINREDKSIHSKYSNHLKVQSAGRKSDSNLESSNKNNRKEYTSPSRSRQPLKQVFRSGRSNLESLPNSEPITNVPRSADCSELRRLVKSALPRPSRASSASRSTVRSGIPMPSIMSKKHVEDTWSEGCF